MNETIELDIKDILWTIKLNLKRAGWKKTQIERHIVLHYHKDRITKLSDDELLEFLEFCKQLPDEKLISFKTMEFRKLPPSKIPLYRFSNNQPIF